LLLAAILLIPRRITRKDNENSKIGEKFSIYLQCSQSPTKIFSFAGETDSTKWLKKKNAINIILLSSTDIDTTVAQRPAMDHSAERRRMFLTNLTKKVTYSHYYS